MHSTSNNQYLHAPLDAVRALTKALPHRRLDLRSEKFSARFENTAEEKLMNATSDAQEHLLAATTVFPFALFPDNVFLDREKLTIIKRSFFSTAETISMQIQDIQSVQGNVGPFFGNLLITTKYFDNSTHTIKFLRRKDVNKFQKLIQGSLIAYQRKIDCSNIESEQLVALLTDLGHSA